MICKDMHAALERDELMNKNCKNVPKDMLRIESINSMNLFLFLGFHLYCLSDSSVYPIVLFIR